MAEITALRKHPCPECGGDAEWSASKQALVCPYCGTVLPWSPGKNTPGESIREQELDAALRRAGPENSRLAFRKARGQVSELSGHYRLRGFAR